MSSETQAPPSPGDKTFTLYSWNIHSCIGMDRVCDPHRLSALVAKIDADVVCLQEVGWHLRGTKGFDQFAHMLDVVGGFHFFSLTKTKNAHFGNLIISRLPILDSGELRLGRWWGIPRLMHFVQVDAGGQPVTVINTHFGLDPMERASQFALVTAWVRERLKTNPGEPLVLCGDFNALMNGSRARLLEAQFHEARTFRSFPSTRPIWNLDRMLAANMAQYTEFGILDDPAYAHASDHLPVFGRFALG